MKKFLTGKAPAPGKKKKCNKFCWLNWGSSYQFSLGKDKNTGLMLGCMLDPKWMQVRSDVTMTRRSKPCQTVTSICRRFMPPRVHPMYVTKAVVPHSKRESRSRTIRPMMRGRIQSCKTASWCTATLRQSALQQPQRAYVRHRPTSRRLSLLNSEHCALNRADHCILPLKSGIKTAHISTQPTSIGSTWSGACITPISLNPLVLVGIFCSLSWARSRLGGQLVGCRSPSACPR